uniref:EF-hand domain-containing protein n=1 Tax=Anopheles coluzzii TaxID=1518534 RepID=A0A8W7PZ79_ANOCL
MSATAHRSHLAQHSSYHRALRTVLVRVMASIRPNRSTGQTKKPTNKPGSAKKRPTSNVFSVLEQHQVAELRELFNLLDTSHAGVVGREELRDMLTVWYERAPTEQLLDELMAEARGLPLNFTLFLTLFAQKLRDTDPPEVLQNAFRCFDSNGDGTVDAAELRLWLTTKGDQRLTDEQVDEIFCRLVPENGRVKYDALANLFHDC